MNQFNTGAFMVNEQFLKEVLKQNYDIEGEFVQLGGYELQQYKIKQENSFKFILKVIESSDNDYFENALSQMFKLLSKESKLYQKNIQNIYKQDLTEFTYEGKIFYMRILTYLEGYLLGDIFKNFTNEYLENHGKVLGQQTKIMQQFSHSGSKIRHSLVWNLTNFLNIKDKLQYIEDPHLNRIVNYNILMFERHVQPLVHKLRKSTIQMDFNDYNILVDEKCTQIVGIIDFIDMAHSPTIFELAIALAYIIILDPTQFIQNCMQIIKSYNQEFSIQEIELSILFKLVAARLSTTILMASEKKVHYPENIYYQISMNGAIKAVNQLYKINPLHLENQSRIACNLKPLWETNDVSNQHASHLEQRNQVLCRAMSICYKRPLNIVQGIYQYLFDDLGNTYIDCANNVQHVGHCHPNVCRVAANQYSQLNINTRYISEPLLKYTQELKQLFQHPLEYIFLVNSGTEANELALRLARNYSKSKETIVVQQNYHGHSGATIDISQYKFGGKGGQGKQDFIHVLPLPDPKREINMNTEENINKILDKLKQNGKKAGCFIGESIFSIAGYFEPPKNFLKTIYKKVREQGGVCIADEIQVGFGRVGSHFWGFQLQDVIPDIVTMGKPIGNGHPIGAVICTKEIADAFHNGMEYFNTFSGTQVSCQIGLEVLKTIKNEKLQQNALEVGTYFQQELKKLRSNLIYDVRGKGLFIGVELCKNGQPAVEETEMLNELLKNEGVLVGTDGYLHNVLKIKPSLCLTKENVDFIIICFQKCLDQIESSL